MTEIFLLTKFEKKNEKKTQLFSSTVQIDDVARFFASSRLFIERFASTKSVGRQTQRTSLLGFEVRIFLFSRKKKVFGFFCRHEFQFEPFDRFAERIESTRTFTNNQFVDEQVKERRTFSSHCSFFRTETDFFVYRRFSTN